MSLRFLPEYRPGFFLCTVSLDTFLKVPKPFIMFIEIFSRNPTGNSSQQFFGAFPYFIPLVSLLRIFREIPFGIPQEIHLRKPLKIILQNFLQKRVQSFLLNSCRNSTENASEGFAEKFSGNSSASSQSLLKFIQVYFRKCLQNLYLKKTSRSLYENSTRISSENTSWNSLGNASSKFPEYFHLNSLGISFLI